MSCYKVMCLVTSLLVAIPVVNVRQLRYRFATDHPKKLRKERVRDRRHATEVGPKLRSGGRSTTAGFLTDLYGNTKGRSKKFQHGSTNHSHVVVRSTV